LTRPATTLLAAAILLTAACQRAPRPPDTLVVAQSAEPKSLDPHVATSLNDFRILENVFEGLVRFKPGTMEIEPALATAWTVSPDGKTWTFDLRDDVVFHDGSRFDSEAVRFTFERLLDPQHPAADTGPFPLSFFFSRIDSIETPAPDRVVFHLKEPFAPFLANLAYPAGFIVSPSALGEKNRHTFSREPSGTGPFQVAEWQPNNFVRLVPNPRWRGDAPHLAQVLFRPVADENTRLATLLAGEADVVVEVPPDLIGHFRGRNDFHVLEESGPHLWFLILNNRDGPLADPRVRRAVNLAIDKRSLVDDLLQHTATIAAGPVPEAFGAAFDPSLHPWPHDPEEARRLVREAGAEGANLTLLATESGSGMLDPKAMAAAIQSDLAAIGLEVSIRTWEWNTFLKKVNAGLGPGEDMAMMAWMTNDPDTLPSLALHSRSWPEHGGFNSGRYANPEVDDLIDAARRETDPAARNALYHRLQRIVHHDAPWAFIASWRQNAVTRRAVEGLRLEPSFLFRLAPVRLASPPP
jgi:peptide/nickel transport system substrate-binding protein